MKQKRKSPWGAEWGESKGNFGSNRDRTSDIGDYPGGTSAYGLGDVVGNVREWCSTRWRDESGKDYVYPYEGEDGREELSGGDDVWRILRAYGWGGGMAGSRRQSRCGCRYSYYPWSVYSDRGFRCMTPHAFSIGDSDPPKDGG